MSCRNHPSQVVGTVRCDTCKGEFCLDCAARLGGYFYCAECGREREGYVPPGTGPTAPDLAPVWKRSGGALIDWFVTLPPTAIIFLSVAMSSFERRLDGPAPERLVSLGLLFSLIAGAIWFVYEGGMLCWRGQTLGKMALGIKVVAPEGEDSTPGRLWLRAAVRGAFHAALYFLFPVGFLVAMADYVPAFMGAEKKAVHDGIAKTRVIDWRG